MVVIDTLILSKDSLDAPVNYTAEDSGVLVISTKAIFFYTVRLLPTTLISNLMQTLLLMIRAHK